MTITLRAGVLNSGIQQNGTEFLTVDTSNNATLSNNLAVTGAVSGTTGTFTSTLGVTGAITGSSTVAGSTGILYPLTSGTAVATTSGTSIDFTSIPSWVKRITVMLSGVGTNGTSNPILRLGTSGGIESTSYAGSVTTNFGTNAGAYTKSISTGFDAVYDWSASETIAGQYIVSLLGSNVWVCTWAFGFTNAGRTQFGGGTKTLSGTLDRVRFTTTNGTDTFDAGSVNILYE